MALGRHEAVPAAALGSHGERPLLLSGDFWLLFSKQQPHPEAEFAQPRSRDL